MMEKKVAVVILNWNGAAMMRRFLPSVIGNSPEAEVIVADNGSTDGSLEMLEKDFPAVRTVPFEINYGFAEGYNKALAVIEQPYAVLLNSDVEVPHDWLAPLITFMDGHKDVAACQPKLLKESDREFYEYAGAAGGFIDVLGYPFCRGRIMQHVEKDKGQYDEPAPVFWATGAALFVRTNVYNMVGGLDSRFFAHSEEIDFCWRLRNRGWGIWCIPQSVVYHVGGGTLNKENPRKTFLNFRNNLLMLYKNLPPKDFWWVLLLRYFLDYLAMLQMFFSGHRQDALAVVRARFEYKHICHEFDDKRKANLAATTNPYPAEVFRGSLLWNYYVRGRKTFKELMLTK